MRNTKIKHKGGTVDSNNLYSISEYARILGVEPSTVKYRVLTGKLDSVKFNGSELVIGRKEDIDGK